MFDRKPQPTELFAQAKRLAYFPRGHLRTHSGVALGVEVKNLNGKIDRVDQLRPGPVEIVKAHRGLDGSQCPAPKAEELWWLLDESNQWKFTQNHTRTWLASEWLFHVDDLPIGMVRANTANQRHTPSTVKREARKLETQAMYASWQKAYRTLSKKRPGESDVWYSLQIAKDKKLNPLRRDANTIKKNMLT